jgi:hypothetical protein
MSLPGRGLELCEFVLIYKEDGCGNLKQEIEDVEEKRKGGKEQSLLNVWTDQRVRDDVVRKADLFCNH